MIGKELDGLSLKELQHLENQLTEGILAVKDKKVQVTKTNSGVIDFLILICLISLKDFLCSGPVISSNVI